MDESLELRTRTSEKTDRPGSVALRALAEIDRISPIIRPDEKLIGYHTWLDLLFLHWRVPADEIQALLPPELTVDTFEGDAWVGLVPFKMRKIRPWWSPPVPGISNFYETNVRTYVHHRGKDPGVWFFSLDASSSLAVSVARWRWNLNYFKATMHSIRH
ncbi:MAG TPA: DUF2071 domain-containing protein, partial [Planctomycetaceae bacterium]|nr:DUF2071 domain-containing protein [Planctomycetaceae bacterium]